MQLRNNLSEKPVIGGIFSPANALQDAGIKSYAASPINVARNFPQLWEADKENPQLIEPDATRDKISKIAQEVFEKELGVDSQSLEHLEMNQRFNSYMVEEITYDDNFIAILSERLFQDPDYLRSTPAMKELDTQLNLEHSIRNVTGGDIIDAVTEEYKFTRNLH